MVHTLVKEVTLPNEQVADLDKLIEARFPDHQHFEVITSMPGLGIILGAQLLAGTGDDMAVFGTPTASLPSEASPRSRATPARSAATCDGHIDTTVDSSACSTPPRWSASAGPTNRAGFYDRKRAEGKRHTQAVLALALRRLNVLRALLRDGRSYELTPQTALAS